MSTLLKRVPSSLMGLSALALMLMILSACSSTDTESTSDQAPTAEPAIQLPSGPTKVVETIEATSSDGVLFDLKLSLRVFDQNGSNGRRDDVEVMTPDKTEYQGVFNDGPGTLLIVSCFADACQGDDKTASFEVQYWVEEIPDPRPEGVSIIDG